jgi:hypothetical protein
MPGAPILPRAAVTSINDAWLASKSQCDAALRCESTAPSPHANTAANHSPSRARHTCPTAYTSRYMRCNRPALTRRATPDRLNPAASN